MLELTVQIARGRKRWTHESFDDETAARSEADGHPARNQP
jgi:hypothetical protein